jgi:hypothetical protein
MKFIKISLLALITGFLANANAYTPSTEGKHTISPMLGFMGPGTNAVTDNSAAASLTLSGLFAIGADYEYGLKDDFSVGGLFRYYSTNDTVGTTDDTESVFMLGGLAHAKLVNTEHFSAYIGSGLALLQVTVKRTPQNGSSTTFSPGMTLGLPFALGVGYKLNDTMTLGIEHMQVMALGDKVNGWPVSDFMVRYSIVL